MPIFPNTYKFSENMIKYNKEKEQTEESSIKE